MKRLNTLLKAIPRRIHETGKKIVWGRLELMSNVHHVNEALVRSNSGTMQMILAGVRSKDREHKRDSLLGRFAVERVGRSKEFFPSNLSIT